MNLTITTLALTNMQSSLMFFLGCALLTSILLRRTAKYFKKGKRPRPGSGPYLEQLPRPKSEWDGTLKDRASIIERQKVELYEMTRDANGQLNSKITMLEQLVSTSSQQIKQMESLLAELKEAKS